MLFGPRLPGVAFCCHRFVIVCQITGGMIHLRPPRSQFAPPLDYCCADLRFNPPSVDITLAIAEHLWPGRCRRADIDRLNGFRSCQVDEAA